MGRLIAAPVKVAGQSDKSQSDRKAIVAAALAPSPMQLETQGRRLAVCEPCEYFKRVQRNDLGQARVKCDKCGCQGLELWIEGRKCPDGRWGAKADDQTPPEPQASVDPDYFDRVHVVNLDRRSDRWNAFLQRFASWPFRHPERFRALDGELVVCPPWWRAGRATWCIYTAHLRILEAAMMDGLKRVLILEDDAILSPDFNDHVGPYLDAVPADAMQIYLGGQHLVRPTRVNDLVVRASNVNRCHAHAFVGDGIERAYKHLTRFHALAEQHQSAKGSQKGGEKAFHVDHWLGRLHESGEFPVYAPMNWLVGQAEGKSDISLADCKERFWARTMPPVDPPAKSPSGKLRTGVLVVGHPRSGTTYLSRLAAAYGMDYGHEKYGKDGIVSWMAAANHAHPPWGPSRRDIEYDRVVRIVRNPLDVIASSRWTENHPRSRKYREDVLPDLVGVADPWEYAARSVLGWHELIDREFDSGIGVIRVEDSPETAPSMLGWGNRIGDLPPTSVNTRKHDPVTADELAKHLEPDTMSRLRDHAKRFGYDLEIAK